VISQRHVSSPFDHEMEFSSSSVSEEIGMRGHFACFAVLVCPIHYDL
jgi:hypothetical protein